MRFFLRILSPVILLTLLGCNHTESHRNTGSSAAELSITNGLYLIVDETAKSSTGIIIPFNHGFLDDNAAGQPDFLKIDTSEFVPLDLARDPDSTGNPDKRINLLLTLTPAAKDRLADFTEKHLKQKVALVIGGKVVTMHKVRAKIDGGQLQITRCTDNACKKIFLELKDNVKK